ncbi:hypothetical protein C1752_10226 [Acaryochloris thomasi RCC1774]|uniref:Uncharacterized protein n=1 Tax=Acaryochloris thomasi RCC1774 TaxID=1764569 RepID=A0A2W1JN82_9CYAN|nr:ankyrin repeat domain-containing protein [Acaryochloris thomasi]PZD70711.1 hypothetical protein C1752_10226 [Acaryochloris thomasi RCC1774]
MLFRCFAAFAVPLLFLGAAGCDIAIRSPESFASKSASTKPALIEATLAGDVGEVRSHLQSNADPNTTHNTNTALTYAARDGYTEIAQLLIDAGAEVNWIDREGVTPLILASLKGHTKIAQLLLHHGADKTVIDQWNRTALDYALRRGEADPIVKLLRMKQ